MVMVASKNYKDSGAPDPYSLSLVAERSHQNTGVPVSEEDYPWASLMHQ